MVHRQKYSIKDALQCGWFRGIQRLSELAPRFAALHDQPEYWICDGADAYPASIVRKKCTVFYFECGQHGRFRTDTGKKLVLCNQICGRLLQLFTQLPVERKKYQRQRIMSRTSIHKT